MTKRRMYQALLLGCAGLGVVAALLALFNLTNLALAAMALSIVALAGMVHLRALLVQGPARNFSSGAPSAGSGPQSLTAKVDELRRAQAASESFILGELLALRQQLMARDGVAQSQPPASQ